jgi:hypothetical protein
VKQNTSLDIPSKKYANSVLKNSKPSNDPEKKDDRQYNQGHRYNQSNKDFDDYQKTPNFRPVFIDGNNIGHAYGRTKGNRKNFSAKGLWIAYSFFKDLGYRDNQIFIIQRKIQEKYLTREDLDIMDNLRDLKVLQDLESRIDHDQGRKDVIQPDDDLLIIRLAWELNGLSKKKLLFLICICIPYCFFSHKLEHCTNFKFNTKCCFFFTVLSKDQYRKYWKAHASYREVQWRLVEPIFINDIMILPKDPQGPKGPTLEKILKK